MIRLPCYLTGFSSKSDGSASVRFNTQELTAEDFANLKNDLNGYGWLVFQSNEVKLEDMPKEDAEDKQKTPSKRLRAVIFIEWTQKGKQGDFEQFYREKMDRVIEHFKSKLD